MGAGRRLAGLVAIAVTAVAVAAGSGLAAQERGGAPGSLERILAGLASYDGGIESGARWQLHDYVRAHRDDPAAREQIEDALLRYLGGRATFDAKMEASRHLRMIAGDRAVAPLRALLRDPRAADLAIYVLQQVPGEAAERVLAQELSALARRTSADASRTARGLVAALGERRNPSAVPALAPLLTHRDLAAAAANALGRIGDATARDALVAAHPAAPASLKPVFAAAMLACAEQAIKAADAGAALRLYEMLAADASLPLPARRAARLGRIDASGAAAPQVLLQMLAEPEAEAQESAIARVQQVIRPDGIEPVCAMLPRLREASQVQLLAVLATYPGDRVGACVGAAARSDAEPVRIAALRALASVGSASVVAALVETAARSRGQEQATARTALGSLKGRAVDEAIVKALEAGPAPDLESELLLAIADRRIFPAKPAVASSLKSPAPRTRVQALKSLRTIGTPSDVSAVLDLLVNEADEAVRNEAELTAAGLAGKVATPERRSTLVKARLKSERQPAARARVLAVLPLIGDSSALPDVRAALAHDSAEVVDAAVRAIASWPTSAARDDLFQLASQARNETHRLLAIRGLVRLIALDRFRQPAAAVADLRSAAGFAWRPEEQKLVLGALTQFPCAEAVELARSYLSDASVQAEAQAAIDKITAALSK